MIDEAAEELAGQYPQDELERLKHQRGCLVRAMTPGIGRKKRARLQIQK
jgi:hypothetical protein